MQRSLPLSSVEPNRLREHQHYLRHTQPGVQADGPAEVICARTFQRYGLPLGLYVGQHQKHDPPRSMTLLTKRITALLSDGYFPVQLPPPFSSATLGKAVAALNTSFPPKKALQ